MIKYARRKGALFVVGERPEIHLVFYYFKPLVIILGPPWNVSWAAHVQDGVLQSGLKVLSRGNTNLTVFFFNLEKVEF